jgi:ribosomal-protein-serine acetyltransferase
MARARIRCCNRGMHAPDTPIIRPWARDDAAALHAAVRASLATLGHWLPWASDAYDIDAANDWIAHCTRMRAADDEHHFGVFDADSGVVLGGVGLNHRIRAYRSAHMGYWVADAARGRGVAVAAARQAADFGFGSLGLQRVAILVQPDNRASLRVAIKLGAVCEGIARDAIVFEGVACDAVVFSLLPRDLAASPADAGDD